MKRLFYVFLVVYFSVFGYTNRSALFKKIDINGLISQYQASAYVRGDKSPTMLSDAQYYQVRGIYLIKEGIDLENLPPSHPPLAQYLYGVSIKLFSNPLWVTAVLAVAVLMLISSIARVLFGPLGMIMAVFFAFEPIFMGDLGTTMLDIPLLLLTLLALIVFIRYLNEKNGRIQFLYLSLANLCLGLGFATKFFPVSLPLFGALYLSTLSTGDFKRFQRHTISLLWILVGFALGHYSYFIHHLSIIKFFKFQRYIISWWAGSPQVPPFQVFDMVFFNHWHTWWADFAITTAPGWSITWPILFILSVISLPIVWLCTKSISPILILLYSWFVSSFVLFSFEAVYPRHLIAILPAMYLLSFFTLKSLISFKKTRLT